MRTQSTKKKPSTGGQQRTFSTLLNALQALTYLQPILDLFLDLFATYLQPVLDILSNYFRLIRNIFATYFKSILNLFLF